MTPEANLLTGIANISRLCMIHSTPDFEINMSLYPTKNELNIYVYEGGYKHAWRKPEERIRKLQIKLIEPKAAAQQLHDAFCHVEKMVKAHSNGK